MADSTPTIAEMDAMLAAIKTAQVSALKDAQAATTAFIAEIDAIRAKLPSTTTEASQLIDNCRNTLAMQSTTPMTNLLLRLDPPPVPQMPPMMPASPPPVTANAS